MAPILWSKSMLTPQASVLPQKGQSKICATFGLAFLGGGLARFLLPLAMRGRGWAFRLALGRPD